jgi:hypothetical protein
LDRALSKGRKRDRIKNALGQKLIDLGLKLCNEKKYDRLASSAGTSESPKGTRYPRPSISSSVRTPDYERLVSPPASDDESLRNQQKLQESLRQNPFNPPQLSDREGISSLPSNRFTPTSPYRPDLQGRAPESLESDPGSIKVGPDFAARL